MMLRGAQINYITDKSPVIIIIINTQGQFVLMYFIRKDCLNMKSLCGLQIPFTAKPFSADKLGYLLDDSDSTTFLSILQINTFILLYR